MSARRLFIWKVALIVLSIALWQLFADTKVINPFYVSRPSTVAVGFYHLASSRALYSALWITAQEIIWGLLIGSALGIIAGILLGIRPIAFDAISPIFNTLYTVPRLALLPVFLLWFGVGKGSKIALVISLVFFSMLLNTYSGARDVDVALVDAVRLMGGRTREIIKEVIIPSVTPWILTGLRISLVFSVTGAVVGEMLASQGGLGYMLSLDSGVFDTTGVFSILVVVAILANVLSVGMSFLERRVVWQGSPQGGRGGRGGRRGARVDLSGDEMVTPNLGAIPGSSNS